MSAVSPSAGPSALPPAQPTAVVSSAPRVGVEYLTHIHHSIHSVVAVSSFTPFIVFADRVHVSSTSSIVLHSEVKEQVYDRWTTAMVSMDLEAFLRLFTDDASRVIQDCPVQHGKAAIRAFQAPLMERLRPIGIKDNTFQVTYTVDPSHSNAVDLMTCFTKQTFHLNTGDRHVTYHMAVVKRSPKNGGEWKIHQFVGCTVKDEPSSITVKNMIS